MRVFISWSGEKSRHLARLLRNKLPDVLQALDPFMSDEDIPKGAQWPDELKKQFDSVKFAIVCVTSDNMTSPWLNFESGAVSNAIGKPNVCPLLLDLAPADLTGPLASFQAARCSQADVLKLVQSMNKQLPTKLSDERLQYAFGRWWPEFERGLEDGKKIGPEAKPKPRETNEIVRETLLLVREQGEAVAELLNRVPAPLYLYNTTNPFKAPGGSFTLGEATLGSASLGVSPGSPESWKAYAAALGDPSVLGSEDYATAIRKLRERVDRERAEKALDNEDGPPKPHNE